ncbi:hypothetical protein EW146_g9381 [Bondarzewia mesenterica]|uniref:Uncharacterized protein n=1 Tax=Bondarzewia mesenterica TaxID=1095465 RepID=A0A4S4L736_9AGAM|nr:hypothetical protein EW146_g9381 [Bondarzewia mesenterica]
MSSSSLPSFNRTAYIRELTPSGIAMAVSAATSEHASNRMLALSQASSFDEVVSTLPLEYRERLRQPLAMLRAHVEQGSAAQASLDKLEQHKANGTWPPQLLGIKPAEFQFHKSFLDANGGEAVNAPINAQFYEYRNAVLNLAIDAKREEAQYFVTETTATKYLPGLRAVLDAAFAEIRERRQKPEWIRHPETGDLSFGKWELDPLVQIQYNRLLDDLPTYASHLIAISSLKEEAAAAKVKAKRELKKSADVEMGDASSSSKSVTQLVDERLSAALKKMGLNDKKGGGPKGKGKGKAQRGKDDDKKKKSSASKKQKPGKNAGPSKKKKSPPKPKGNGKGKQRQN